MLAKGDFPRNYAPVEQRVTGICCVHRLKEQRMEYKERLEDCLQKNTSVTTSR